MAKKPKAPETVESNHNTTAPAKPVAVANLKGKPDYNPMRREGSKANVLSDTSMNEADNAAVVEAKGDRPAGEPVIEDGWHGKED